MDNIVTRDRKIDIPLLIEGGMLLIDKPINWTSFDVVNKLRYTIKRKLGRKKYKIGHAGTLDPLATGLLLVCFSSYTKKIEQLMGLDKTYSGTIKMWETTPSMDRETRTDQFFPRIRYSSAELDRCRKGFLGESYQVPPLYSAIKMDGVRLYKLAREGKSVKLKSRKININSFELNSLDYPLIGFTTNVSKGTYVRSLAYDFGKCLGSGAHLYSLRRLAIGNYDIEDAWTVDETVRAIQNLEPE